MRNSRILRFFSVGVVSTIVDWCSFILLSSVFGINYIIALIISILLGGIVNYILNKIYSFYSETKKYMQQYSMHLSVTVFGVALSSGMLFILVDIVSLDKVLARIIVTFIMFLINYLLHSFLTYNNAIWGDNIVKR